MDENTVRTTTVSDLDLENRSKKQGHGGIRAPKRDVDKAKWQAQPKEPPNRERRTSAK